MILTEESPLNNLPKELPMNQLLILDSLRFSLQMLDHNFENLYEMLTIISKTNKKGKEAIAFNYAWAIIDHGQRFYDLYRKLNNSEESVVRRISYLYSFRNAIQHVTNNIETRKIDKKLPIYGTLKWVVFDGSLNYAYTSILISGIFNLKDVKFKQHRQEGYSEYINDILLETDPFDRGADTEINLSQLLVDFQFIVHELNENLLKQFAERNLQLCDWSKQKDVLFNMKN